MGWKARIRMDLYSGERKGGEKLGCGRIYTLERDYVKKQDVNVV